MKKEARESLAESIRGGKVRVTVSRADKPDEPRDSDSIEIDIHAAENMESLVQMVLNENIPFDVILNDPPFSLAAVVIPEKKVTEGTLIKATSIAWNALVEQLSDDWSLAYTIPPEKWEEIVAGAYVKAGFEVILTPRSGDHGRDIIAVSKGVGCVKLLGSVKAHKPGHLVGYDDIRALMGVVAGERDASKGILTTTSDFPPNVHKDPIIAPFMPTRLELMNGEELRKWLTALAKK